MGRREEKKKKKQKNLSEKQKEKGETLMESPATQIKSQCSSGKKKKRHLNKTGKALFFS